MNDGNKVTLINHIADHTDTTTDNIDGAERDKDEASAKSLREDMQPAFDAITARVQRLAAKGRTAAIQAQRQAGEKLHEYADKTSAYVAEKPLQSIAIAAGVGAAVAWLLGRRRD